MAIPGMPIALLCVLVFAIGLIQSPAAAAQNAVTREVFTDDELYLRSQDLRGITTNTLMLLGLAGGGLLVVAHRHQLGADDRRGDVPGERGRGAPVREEPPGRRQHGRTAGSPPRKWVFGNSRMRVLLTLSWLVGLVVIPEGLVAPLAKELGATDAAVGWLLAADPLGFVVGTYVLSRFVGADAPGPVHGRARDLFVGNTRRLRVNAAHRLSRLSC